MRSNASVILTALALASCTGVRSVQLHPPAAPPAGMVWGYGVEKLSGSNMERVKQSAYLKAIDDLLTHGPVLVSKTVEDHTTVLDLKPANRTLASTFRLRASRILQPSFVDTGVDNGFVWVLVATTEEDLERGWQQFAAWRSERMAQAERLFRDAQGPERVSLLKASFALLEEVGAQDDPGMLYYQVKSAIESENMRIVRLEQFQKEFRRLTDSGQLLAAETVLDQALESGLDEPRYRQCRGEINDRRSQAAQFITIGDGLFQDAQYKLALERYREAQKWDRNNPELPNKLAMAERYHRQARGENVRATVGFVLPAATKAVGEYFAYKREQERRKRAESEKAAQEARQAEAKRAAEKQPAATKLPVEATQGAKSDENKQEDKTETGP